MSDIDLLDALPADLYEITRLIAGVESSGSFATCFTLPASGLDLFVEGVGKIVLPVLAATSQKLKRAARPAKYGLKDQTLLDPSVRDSWEIPGDRVEISPRWQPVLDKALVRIRRDLGLAMDCELEARLHNLLIYSRGQFFATHQDSEKEDGMIGSLVVGLPSRFSGGDFEIHHHDEVMVSTGSESALSVVAFYADCRHEIRPITGGHRVVLTWNLVVRNPVALDAPPEAPVDVLTRRIQTWFQTPRPARWEGDRGAVQPDRLVYLLDHEYTQRGLGWDQLKNADALRAATLREVAGRLDCEIYLALADVHETWSCEDDYAGYGYRGRYRDFDDDDDDASDDEDDFGDEDDGVYDYGGGRSRGRSRKRGAAGHELTELIDSQIELRHWVAPGRRSLEPISVDIDNREICYTKPSLDCEPFESEHEGYTGNAGNTVDHWYHRAAIVMWPREHSFVIRAKASAPWAIDELARNLASDGRQAALARTRRILPFWPDGVARFGPGDGMGAADVIWAEPAARGRVEAGALADSDAPGKARSALLVATLKLVIGLDEAELSDVSAALLAPFHLVDLLPDVAPHLVELVKARGIDGGRTVLGAWLVPPGRPGANDVMYAWLSDSLLTLCRALSLGTVTPEAAPRKGRASKAKSAQARPAEATGVGRVLAAEILLNRWNWLQQQIDAIRKGSDPDRAGRALSLLGGPLLALIEGCGVADQAGLSNQIIGFLAEGLAEDPGADRVDAVPLQLPLALLRAARGRSEAVPRDTWRGLGLASLQEHLARALKARLARPRRADDDWSILTPIGCNCELCATLKRFLHAPRDQRFEWPLAEQRRRHIHGIIDSHGLPVRHATRRQGSPYTLVLEKTRAVFEREAAARQSWADDLGWIESPARAS